MAGRRLLVLEDGTIFRGYSFGSGKVVFGEVVFNTGMTGYQEALTDPSYRGQILAMTYPLIGNYGCSRNSMESEKIQVRGFIVSEACFEPSNYTSEKNIDKFLKDHGIPGISGVDTRALTIKLREHGTLRGMICKSKADAKNIKKRPFPDSEDLLPEVTRKRAENYGKGKRIVLIDCGVKQNIIRCLVKRKCEVVTVPAETRAEKILKLEPKGILISNGPGDPSKPEYVIETVKELMEKQIPMFGICLGNQILGLAAGANTYKLKFGHRGLNHPVKDLKTGKVHITTQNHGYAINPGSLRKTGFEISHINLNDNSVEGIRHKKLPFFAVQYHPEASPGPRDNEYLFDEFVRLL